MPYCQSLPTLSFHAQLPPTHTHTLSLPYLILGENNSRKGRERGLVRKKNEKVKEKCRTKHKARFIQ